MNVFGDLLGWILAGGGAFFGLVLLGVALSARCTDPNCEICERAPQ